MKQELKWLNLYNLALFREGAIYDGFTRAEMPGSLSLEGDGGLAFFLSPVFDTREEGASFNRLVLDGQFENVRLEVIAAASDININFRNKTTQAIKEIMSGLRNINKIDTTDILLHDIKGRYVWVLLILSPKKDGFYGFKGMRLEFPKYSFIEYFPEIYQTMPNDFFERYISIFQSIFLDVEGKVDKIPIRLDYRSAPEEDVKELSEWLGIDNTRGLFNTSKLRKIIRDIDIYQGKKGTKEALICVIELLTGIRPTIIEHFQWAKKEFSACSEYEALYGDGSDCFCVILDLTRRDCPIPIPLKLNIRNSDLEYIVESYSPMGSQFRIMYLYPNSCINEHCYLDVNAAISRPEVLELDNDALTMGDHVIVG